MMGFVASLLEHVTKPTISDIMSLAQHENKTA